MKFEFKKKMLGKNIKIIRMSGKKYEMRGIKEEIKLIIGTFACF